MAGHASAASSRLGGWPTIPSRWKELAQEFGISRERARQIELRAFEKVQDAVKTRIAEIEAPWRPTDTVF
jgi:Sigma-70, region 4